MSNGRFKMKGAPSRSPVHGESSWFGDHGLLGRALHRQEELRSNPNKKGAKISKQRGLYSKLRRDIRSKRARGDF